jgi:hypothetical protein
MNEPPFHPRLRIDGMFALDRGGLPHASSYVFQLLQGTPHVCKAFIKRSRPFYRQKAGIDLLRGLMQLNEYRIQFVPHCSQGHLAGLYLRTTLSLVQQRLKSPTHLKRRGKELPFSV